MLPVHSKSAKRFIRYKTLCPQSHAECWAGNAPTTLHETATVKFPARCSLFPPLNHDGFTTSHVALMCGSAATARLVLDSVHDVGNIRTSNGLTLLHAAALGGQPVDVLQQLIQRGCSPTSKDANGRSVMHYAATGGSIEAMKLVVANGGSVTDKDNAARTVMMAAAEGGSIEAMKWILGNGGTVTGKDNMAYTVMMAAAGGGSVEAMKFILANGGTMSETAIDGFDVMMAAAGGGFIDAMKLVPNPNPAPTAHLAIVEPSQPCWS